jgi:hypothetical protein
MDGTNTANPEATFGNGAYFADVYSKTQQN